MISPFYMCVHLPHQASRMVPLYYLYSIIAGNAIFVHTTIDAYMDGVKNISENRQVS